MLQVAKNIYDYRELMATLAWKNIALRYKQAYLGILWAVIKPITPNAIEVHVSRLRHKLAAGTIVIRTVRGIGYRVDAPQN